jgi:hypothetical protein
VRTKGWGFPFSSLASVAAASLAIAAARILGINGFCGAGRSGWAFNHGTCGAEAVRGGANIDEAYNREVKSKPADFGGPEGAALLPLSMVNPSIWLSSQLSYSTQYEGERSGISVEAPTDRLFQRL